MLTIFGKSYIAKSRSSCPEVFSKKVASKILQNSQENNCAKIPFLIKLQASGLQLYKKKYFGTRVAAILGKFLKTIPFLKTRLW